MRKDGRVEILLVDDREENLLALEAMFSHENYEFVKADSGHAALKVLLKDHDFAIILMDVQMPVMDGFETAALIRQSERFKHVPIIFLTADTTNQEDIFKGYKTGAVDYMVKPVVPEILRAKVAVFVDLYKKNKELVSQSEGMRELNSMLQQQSHYVRSLLEATIDPIITVNIDGKITDMNEALTKVTSLQRDNIQGSDFHAYFTKPENAKQVIEEIFSKGSVNDYILTIRGAGSKSTEVLINGSVYRDIEGNIAGAVIVAREKILSKYSRTLIEASLDPLITINSEGKITDMNQALADITGINREEIKGTDFLDYFTDKQKAREVYKEAFAKGFVVDYPLTIRHKEGKLTDVLFNGSVYKDERGNELGVVIVARDITARKKFENQLIEAKKNAEKAARLAEEAVKAKQQFLSNMSHEIRTPLNAIIGFTKVVLKTPLDAKQKEYIDAIKISGDALIVLINDILDLAKVEAGKMTFEQIPFKLSNSLNAMIHLFETKIKEKSLALEKSYDKNIPEVLVGDPVRLHQIILNLLSNAIKFTPKGKIKVGAKMIGESDKKVEIEFYVEDTGIGIPENKLGSIFDNFQQATSATARLYGGTGLGLAIARQLVVSQGGVIHVKSKVGEGSIFSFTLPFKKTHEKVKGEAAQNTEVSSNGADNLKVLVVEDVALNQLLMKTILEDFGFEVAMASNGKESVDLLRDKKFDVVLMDLQMPVMNGYEATTIIRNELKLDVPIIALTADVTTADVEKCRAVGMNDYVAKPIDEKLLLSKIGHFTKQHRHSSPPHDNGAKTNGHHRLTSLEFLKQLTKNNNEMMAEMIRVYLDETPTLVNRMKGGIAEENWEEVRAAAHALVPSFATMGMKEDYAVKTRMIQDLAEKHEQKENIKGLVNEIEEACNTAYRELQQEMVVL